MRTSRQTAPDLVDLRLRQKSGSDVSGRRAPIGHDDQCGLDSRRDGAADEEPTSRCGAGERQIRPWRGRF
ncbi:hypothetical protein M6B38_286390 [Iris pallida]|uniref:Uncharacterized protein n=1 Tax=Iris pallida TaxID=29817 RepID=A0AAX6HZK5_IRIPA|nr:hypothetical protein M6B38_286390 [Iris pallida]